jgi:hypothetical protein
LDVEPHQQTVRVFLQGVEGRLRRLVDLPASHLRRRETAERVERELVEPCALRREPVLEGRRRHPHAIEQRAAIERHGGVERLRRALSHEPLEVHHVHVERGRVHGDGVALRDECRARRARQDPAQADQRISQALARLPLRGVASQEPGQRVTRVRAAEAQREIGQQRLRLARRQRAGARIGAEQEPTEE